jgi:group I intron endonuclease
MIIYKITNLMNSKKYIGQTVSLKYRWNRHKKSNSQCIALKNAIQKYGQENFIIEVISRCSSLQEANHREEYYIKLFNTLSPNGYNLLKGGNNRGMADSVKQQISKTLSGRKMNFSNPTLRGFNISKAKKGKPISENTLRAMRRAVKCLDTEETFISLSDVTKKYGGYTTNLSKHLKGKVSVFMGLRFEYQELTCNP